MSVPNAARSRLRRAIRVGLLGVALVGLALFSWAVVQARSQGVRSEVYVGGLDHPRGLAFDSKGVLYVAEAGFGGSRRLALDPNEPFRVGATGRVSRVPLAGQRETLDQRLPSILSERHRDYLGPAAVATIGDEVYLLTATGWAADPAYDNLLVRYGADGSKTTVLNYSQHSIANPSLARRSDPRADLPGGMPYGMLALCGKLYTTDGNLEYVQEIDPAGGEPRRLLEYPTSTRVLTGLAAGPDGALYVAEMGLWPYPAGSGQVTRLTLDGEASLAASGVTASLGVAVGQDGAIYVLEHAAPMRQAHNLGRLLRIRADGQHEVLLDGLDLPTAVIAGPDGNLYLSDGGNRSRPGEGRVLRVFVAEPGGLGGLISLVLRLGWLGLGGTVALALALAGGLWLRRNQA